MKAAFEEAFEIDEFKRNFLGVYSNKERLLSLIEDVTEFLPDKIEKIIGEWSTKAMDTLWVVQMLHTLKNSGFNLIKTRYSGPDILVEKNGQKIYIECANPRNWESKEEREAGTWNKKDEFGNIHPIIFNYGSKEKEKILRYRTAIEEKKKQYQKWISHSRIDPTIPFIVAICGGEQSLSETSFHGGTVPEIVKSVLPIGDHFYSVPLDSPENFSIKYNSQQFVLNKNNASIETNLFFKEDYQFISGLLFHPYNILNDSLLDGKGLVYVENFKAENIIPAEIIPDIWWKFSVNQNGQLQYKPFK